MNSILQDLRYAFRTLRKSPGFTFTAVLTLALGLGANGAIFSMVNALLLRPYAFPDLDRLVLIQDSENGRQMSDSRLAPADWSGLEADDSLFENAAAFQFKTFNLARNGDVDTASGYAVSPNLFEVVGVKPLLGRTFLPEEAISGRDDVAVLNYGYWERRFGGDSRIVGSTITMSGRSYTVIGVMPKEFRYPLASEIWTPLTLSPQQMTDRTQRSLNAIARLKKGVSLAAAQGKLANLARTLQAQYPDTNAGRAFTLLRLREEQYRYTGSLFLMLQMAAIFVLLLASLNVGNLVLIRAMSRQRELAIRTALGASQRRLAQFFVSEALVLTLAAGCAAVLAAAWSIKVIRVSISPSYTQWLAGWDAMSVDRRVLASTLALLAVLAVIFGITMALHASHIDVNRGLKEGGRSTSGGHHNRWRNALVVLQVVLAMILLVGAGLMIRGFTRLQEVFNAIDPAHLLRMEVRLPQTSFVEDSKVRTFFTEFVNRIATFPGVDSAALISNPPASNVENTQTFFTIEGRPAIRAGELPSADVQTADVRLFTVLKIPVLDGRVLSEQDGPNAPKVVVISRNMSRRFWANGSPIGQRIKLGDEKSAAPWLRIVGVVDDIQLNWFDPVPRPTVYLPFARAPQRSMAVLVRTAGDPATIAAAVRQAAWAVDPMVPLSGLQPMTVEVFESLAPIRVIGVLMLVFGGVALVLSMIGLYGVVAHSVGERKIEFGIRIALGARSRDVLRLILGEGMILSGIGVASGAVLALLLTKILSSRMFGIIGLSGLVFAGFAGVLLLVSLAASYIPARRATEVDPMETLRYE